MKYWLSLLLFFTSRLFAIPYETKLTRATNTKKKCFLRPNQHGMEDIGLYHCIPNTISSQEAKAYGTI
ncbi:hypothetical protein [Leptospira jelokensis]|uniref:Uncharacterized protein n=1 Tax=Leptospira jelokensis TaxID=2484931 RepID=A0A4Z0ZN95_9LEPT|nr:hypothetical protein [Leptospira jelokensis]TGL57768.1 hypothetical protein EHQ62_17595 [Leptospira jelokensis]